MKTQLFIPDKLKVGYQNRDDTYTKRLAYVIYYDNKGVLRKEKSWSGWIDKGQPIWNDAKEWKDRKVIGHSDPLPVHDFDNVPTEGFVLNKKVGGTKYGWNPRATYSRVFDPRGFEFEITIPNLLFILSETNCFKGKGLEGEFVYAWDGPDLVLLPVGCAEYQECKKFTTLQSGTIKVKDLLLGCSYQTKKQENLIYLGRFPWYEYKSEKIDIQGRGNDSVLKETKLFFFYDEKNVSGYNGPFKLLGSLDSIASLNSDIPVSNYAELMEENGKRKNLIKPIGLESFEKRVDFSLFKCDSWVSNEWYKKESEGRFRPISIYKYSSPSLYNISGHDYNYNIITFIDGKIRCEGHRADYRGYGNSSDKRYTENEIKEMTFYGLNILLENGEKVEFHNYK